MSYLEVEYHWIRKLRRSIAQGTENGVVAFADGGRYPKEGTRTKLHLAHALKMEGSHVLLINNEASEPCSDSHLNIAVFRIRCT